MKFIVLYFASLRDAAQTDSETVDADSRDARELYATLRSRHAFALDGSRLRVAVNGEFTDWSHALSDGDEIAFLPPVSGG